ncbi:MAG TPA: histidinol dehydrogenase [Candidatus Prevotella stercoripullorum]|nr:histidinol dehydrogenase [Candidatus Prevotella stercoripullorum]
MEKYIYPSRDEWKSITARPPVDTYQLQDTVRTILEDVRLGGDDAVKRYEKKFDNASLDSLIVTEDEINEAVRQTPEELLDALALAHDNIGKFHASQRMATKKVETAPGVECWQRSVPIEKVGLYVPGGTAPLFSTVLMLATPAKIAGCGEIVMCTPPGKDGTVTPAILAAAKIAGVHKIFKAGGVQAIAAMAYGTESIPRVYKIFGPGNRYVMAAKQMVSLHDVAIDMPAGPSEVCVIADDTSNPAYVAADLLSQAEHGTDSQVLLITTSETLAANVKSEMEAQLKALPRHDIAAKTLENSKVVIVKDKDEAMALSNMYAPEHLIIATDDCFTLADMVVNAGSVFLGKYACESAGDYASGTNHTLPTHGYATAYSGVNLDSFIRKITFQHLTADGIRHIGRAVEVMADKESLYAHKNAMTLRIKDILNN